MITRQEHDKIAQDYIKDMRLAGVGVELANSLDEKILQKRELRRLKAEYSDHQLNYYELTSGE